MHIILLICVNFWIRNTAKLYNYKENKTTKNYVLSTCVCVGGWGGISTCVCVGGWSGISTCVCVGGVGWDKYMCVCGGGVG